MFLMILIKIASNNVNFHMNKPDGYLLRSPDAVWK